MKLKGALLGAGNIALRGHLPQWLEDGELSSAAEIVAVADLSESNLAAARERLPSARFYRDAARLLEEEVLDFCDICTPPHTHRTLIEQAAGKGIGVVCEKPLAPSLSDALAIEEVVRAGGIAFVPCHQYHYSPQWLAVRENLGRVGRVYYVDYEVQRTAANEGNANWSPAWRTDPRLAGGGILVDHGAHILYQIRAAVGTPESVTATIRTLRHQGYGVEDTALVTLEYEGGLANIRLSWAARRRAIRFRFVGEKGEIVGDDSRVLVCAETEEEISFSDGMSKDSSHSGWYAPLLRGFLDTLGRPERGFDALEEAVYVTRVIGAAYQSAAEGIRVAL